MNTGERDGAQKTYDDAVRLRDALANMCIERKEDPCAVLVAAVMLCIDSAGCLNETEERVVELLHQFFEVHNMVRRLHAS